MKSSAGASQPSLSIIVPSYNQGTFLRGCLESVISIKSEAVQLIVVDGLSTDGSHDILKEYEHVIDVLICEKDDGQSDAIIKGLGVATGHWVTWLNTDDRLLPAFMEILSSQLVAKENPDVIFGNSLRVTSSGSSVYRVQADAFQKLNYHHRLVQPSVVFTRDILERAGGLNADLQFVMDWDLFIRMREAGAKILHVPVTLSEVNIHENQKSTSGSFTMRKRRVLETLEIIATHSEARYVSAYRQMTALFVASRGYLFLTNYLIATACALVWFKCFLMLRPLPILQLWYASKTMKT